jgi:hypothetical protein
MERKFWGIQTVISGKTQVFFGYFSGQFTVRSTISCGRNTYPFTPVATFDAAKRLMVSWPLHGLLMPRTSLHLLVWAWPTFLCSACIDGFLA